MNIKLFIIIMMMPIMANASNVNLHQICYANNGVIRTGFITQAGISHAKDNTWTTLHIKMNINGSDAYYFSTSGANGRGDGFITNMFNIASQSRLFKDQADVCVSPNDQSEILGIENYPNWPK